MSPLRRLLVLSVLLAVGVAVGCETPIHKWPARAVHELKPHRLSRLNQGPALGREHEDF